MPMNALVGFFVSEVPKGVFRDLNIPPSAVDLEFALLDHLVFRPEEVIVQQRSPISDLVVCRHLVLVQPDQPGALALA